MAERVPYIYVVALRGLAISCTTGALLGWLWTRLPARRRDG